MYEGAKSDCKAAMKDWANDTIDRITSQRQESFPDFGAKLL